MLADYRVIDLTDEKGWLCGKILGDLGADVIKVESPEGDHGRQIGPFTSGRDGQKKSLFWLAYNTSKRGMTLNLETGKGRKILENLVQDTDILIESFTPGYLESLGLSYEELLKINPGLIMASITPFGQDGPYSKYCSVDITNMAMSGLMYVCGDNDRPPVALCFPQSYCFAGVATAAAILMANYHRQKTGMGQHIDLSIQEILIWATAYVIPFWTTSKMIYKRSGNYQLRLGNSYRMCYRCKDGYIAYRMGFGVMLGVGQKKITEEMNKEGIGTDLTDIDYLALGVDEMPSDILQRTEQAMQEYFQRHTKAELTELGLKRDIMIYPVLSPSEIAGYEQLMERNYWQQIPDESSGEIISYPGSFLRSSEQDPFIRRPAPNVGEHTSAILNENLGLSEAEIDNLKAEEII